MEGINVIDGVQCLPSPFFLSCDFFRFAIEVKFNRGWIRYKRGQINRYISFAFFNLKVSRILFASWSMVLDFWSLYLERIIFHFFCFVTNRWWSIRFLFFFIWNNRYLPCDFIPWRIYEICVISLIFQQFLKNCNSSDITWFPWSQITYIGCQVTNLILLNK